ncbi:amidohydrolase family protein [Phytohabitans sp. ZYX-F-186]|uniref:Amidohydrolase family protein n=1 Tax=Phytohabitans maris TaxID=3071409 RepID=A0ABU0ZC26_9ACTN|nr:amidohydrolase family protein [Phytohabitans sp. ZYX-F-186]MDQ7904619.1 amidohydrolase family protein [Phytohabitans sp. ZYX-F-186]
MNVIDIHPHILSADREAYPLAPVGGTVSGWASTRPVTAEQLLSEMDTAGVAKAALVQASTAYGYDNRYVIDSAERYPDRFTAICCVDPLSAGAEKRIAEWARHPAVAGVRLFTTGSTLPGQAAWLNHETTYPFWAAASRTGTPVCVQMRLSAVDQLVDVLERFPDATIVLDHMAYPSIAPGTERAAFDELAGLAKYPRLFLKMTMRNTEPLVASDARRFLDPLLAAFGSERIAWGSNFPAATQSLPTLLELATTALAGVPADARRNILCATAQRLYPALR